METRFTKGPWVVERLYNDGGDGASVWTNQDGAVNAEIAGRIMHPANATLIAAAPKLFGALEAMVEKYTALVNCGDCGKWDPETEAEVKAAREALRLATEGSTPRSDVAGPEQVP